MSEVKFTLSYDEYEGFEWCASMEVDGVVLKGLGESLERAAQDLERRLRDQ